MMGASNVSAVLRHWCQLPSSQQLLLVHMALVSLDPPGNGQQPPCLYWGSVELQTLAMGYRGKNAPRTLRALRRGLREAGAIQLARHSAQHRSPTWLVVTDPVDRLTDAPYQWL